MRAPPRHRQQQNRTQEMSLETLATAMQWATARARRRRNRRILGGVRRYSCGGEGRRIQETLARRRCSRAGYGLCCSGSPRRSLSGWDWRIGFKCSLSLSLSCLLAMDGPQRALSSYYALSPLISIPSPLTHPPSTSSSLPSPPSRKDLLFFLLFFVMGKHCFYLIYVAMLLLL